MGERFKRLVGIGGPDADDFSTLQAGIAADHGPAELAGGLVGEDEESVVLARRDGLASDVSRCSAISTCWGVIIL